MKWHELISVPQKAVGEVASVEGSKIEVFIYPEYFSDVGIGSLMVINSLGSIKPIGLVLRLAHTSRLGTFTPLRKPRSEIMRMFPDLENYHKFVVTLSYTSHLTNGDVRHYRGPMPRLHDLVYLVNDEELLLNFFKPDGRLNLDFLIYFISDGASLTELRDFIFKYSKLISSKIGIYEFIGEMVKVLTKVGVKDVIPYIEETIKTLGDYA
ncbi:MAG TPA: hypothetical protein ENF75_00900 [Acidilobales archaeon]|nr:hypothetical protein [Acidilobales archaeon]